jgi:hypothetical protein
MKDLNKNNSQFGAATSNSFLLTLTMAQEKDSGFPFVPIR